MYNKENLLKTKKFSTKKCLNTKKAMDEFFINLKKIHNWTDRVKFTKELIVSCPWSEELNKSKKIRKIKFIYMDYNKKRPGFLGPFNSDTFHNPKKIIGLMRAVTKLKSKCFDSFVYL